MTAHDPGLFAHEPGLPAPGTSVGGYVVVRQVGRGGMAAVFEARHQSLGKRVALKMLLPHHAERSSIARRFIREGEAAASLNHAHAVDVTDVGTDARGAPYLVMEFLEGEDLASMLDRQGKLGVEETADLLVPVISAIAAAHELGIVHRDLKPNNIFLARRRDQIVPKVVDFGISKVEAESMKLTATSALLGTPHYMSPEQAQGAEHLDARSDQFALGVILYECVTGKRPFDGGSLWGVLAQIIHGTPTPAIKVLPSLPPAFDALIDRALQKDPSARFADAHALGLRLIRFASARIRHSYGHEFGLSQDERTHGSNPSRNSLRPRRSLYDRLASSSAATMPGEGGDEGAPPVVRKSTPWKWPLIGSSLAVGAVALGLSQYQPAAPRIPPAAPAVEAPVVVAPVVAEPAPVVSAPEPAEFAVEVTVRPPLAQIKLDGELIGRGTATRKLKADGTEHVLDLSATGHRPLAVRFKDAPPATTFTLEKLGVQKPASAPVAAVPPPAAKPEAAKPEPVQAQPESPPPASQRYGTNGAAILR